MLYKKFSKKIKERFPDCFYYKIPDTAGLGGKRPFDSFLLVEGISFAIEFKSKGDELTPYQVCTLKLFQNAGGNSLVFSDGNDMDAFITYIAHLVKNSKLEVK